MIQGSCSHLGKGEDSLRQTRALPFGYRTTEARTELEFPPGSLMLKGESCCLVTAGGEACLQEMSAQSGIYSPGKGQAS